MNRTLHLLLIQLVVTLPVSAQELLSNTGFETDTVPWTAPAPVVLAHTAVDGFSAPGAAETEGVIGSFTGIRQCIDLSGLDLTEPLYAYAAFKPVNYAPSVVFYTVTFHEDTLCSMGFGNQVDIGFFGIEGEWLVVTGLVGEVPVGSLSAGVSVILDSSNPDAITRFDDVHLGTDRILFVDGFESGDTSRWSTTVP